ncbi:MAG: hypothetical protein JWM59_692 [Verrucomicrobiales bacterium]|nr:hypothetical protein [Verrucomicrobiales bacterium]
MMTPLKQSEKRLLAVFGIAGFLLINLVGFSWYSKKMLVLDQQRSKLETRSRMLASMKARAPEAEQKQAWLAQHLKAYPDPTTRDSYLDNFVIDLSKNLNLELKKNQALEPKLEDLFHKSRYHGEVTGQWGDVLEFIYQLQKPGEFRFVPTISLKSQKKEAASEEAADVVCVFDIEKWWSPESVTDPAAAAENQTASSASLPDSTEHSPPVLVRNHKVNTEAK